jgi:NAD(P)-dependent dehydrogenase (short-subunit alcohol dehydrogenase family)
MATPRFSTALVTGANRGLGLEFVRQLLDAGSRVVAVCRARSSADGLRDLQVRHGDKLEIAELEVGNLPALTAFRPPLAEGCGLDLLIHNAAMLGGPRANGIEMVAPEGFDEVFRVNVAAPLFLTKALLPCLAAGRAPVVTVLGSRTGLVSDVLEEPGRDLFYSTSKAAAHRLVTALASELAPRGVTVVGVNPGWVLTGMTSDGPSKPTLLPEESVAGVLEVLSRVQAADTGRFFHYNGSRARWEAVSPERV